MFYFLRKRVSILFIFIFKLNIIISHLPLSTKIAYWGTWNIPCGIAMYTKHLVGELEYKGYQVKVYPHLLNSGEILNKVKQDNIQILNIQYEQSIMPPLKIFLNILQILHRQNVKIILTVHSESPDLIKLVKKVDLIICHKPLKYIHDMSKIKQLPMAIPVINKKKSMIKENLRIKYGFTKNCKIITTTGFMLYTKQIDKILEAFVSQLKKYPNYKIQLLTPFTPRTEACKVEYLKISNVINKYKLTDQVVHITRFLPQEELSERIYISDVGYQWFSENTLATSAAGKEFISVGIPLVVPNSTHFHDLSFGVIKTPMYNFKAFISTILKLLEDKEHQKQLKIQMREAYKKLNYRKVIDLHLELFDKLFESN